MSATVLGCGHTSHMKLFAIDVVMAVPQVHLHFFTDEQEYEENGYAKVEICCHGCGASLLVYYMNNDKPDRRVQIRDDFAKRHRGCPNHSYQSSCPDWRTSFKRIDIRQPIIHWDVSVKPLVRQRSQKKALYPHASKPAPRVRKSPDNT